mmetsp:Transcript_74647/g.218684  ORF Transcript_74647/g.218684 Transcript_74647/m.218684 type:complete len:338 (+) Transcript_74647:553-1566(+)
MDDAGDEQPPLRRAVLAARRHGRRGLGHHLRRLGDRLRRHRRGLGVGPPLLLVARRARGALGRGPLPLPLAGLGHRLRLERLLLRLLRQEHCLLGLLCQEPGLLRQLLGPRHLGTDLVHGLVVGLRLRGQSRRRRLLRPVGGRGRGRRRRLLRRDGVPAGPPLLVLLRRGVGGGLLRGRLPPGQVLGADQLQRRGGFPQRDAVGSLPLVAALGPEGQGRQGRDTIPRGADPPAAVGVVRGRRPEVEQVEAVLGDVDGLAVVVRVVAARVHLHPRRLGLPHLAHEARDEAEGRAAAAQRHALPGARGLRPAARPRGLRRRRARAGAPCRRARAGAPGR